jgi:adenylate kinase
MSTGDMLRQAIADGTTLGVEAKVFMDAGDLVPDRVMIGMIRERLDGDAANFLLDGFPRTLAQAEALDQMLSDVGAPLDAVLSLAVSRDELVRRLAGRWLCRRCGRSYHEVFSPYDPEVPCEKGGRCDLYQRDDDRSEAVANRLSVYDDQTAPLIDYYRGRGLLREVDGEGGQDEVHGQITALVAAIG